MLDRSHTYIKALTSASPRLGDSFHRAYFHYREKFKWVEINWENCHSGQV